MSEPEKKKAPIKGAVAITYTKVDPAPKISAKGKGVLAEKIIEIAKKNNVPIKEDRELMTMLSVLELNEFVPPAMYKAVAEVLAFVYSINKKMEQL